MKVGGVNSSFFQLALGVSFKLTLDAINKSLKVPKVFLEEGFEVRPHDGSCAFMAMLMLSPSRADGATKIWGSKWDIIHYNDD